MPYTPVPSYSTNPRLKRSTKFGAAMREAITIRGQIEALEARLSVLKTQRIEPELIAAGIEGRVEYEGWQVVVVERREGQKLNRKKLMVAMEQRGYDTSIVAEAMEITPGSHYVELRGPKEATNENDVTETPRRMLHQ